MNAIEILLEFPFMQRALLAAVAVAVVCGFLGVFIVLRGMSMLGDGIAHMSFAGVALGVATGFYPFSIALVTAVIGAIALHFLRAYKVVAGDTAIGILFTAGLATGVVIISYSGGLNVGLHTYLFGSILTILPRDVWFVVAVGAALILLFVLFYKEFLYLTLSEEAAQVAGLPVAFLNILFTAVAAATIVAAARVVGILLVSALLIVPAAASLQLARSFRTVILLSMTFGVVAAVTGMLAAAEYGLAPGGAIALVSTAIFIGSVTMKGFVAGRA